MRKALQQMQQLTMQSGDIEPQPTEDQDCDQEDHYGQEPDSPDCDQDNNTGSFVDVEAPIHAVQNAADDRISKDDLLSLQQQNGATYTLQTLGSTLDEPGAQVMYNGTAVSLPKAIVDTGASIDCAPSDCDKLFLNSTFSLAPPINIAMGKGRMEIHNGGLILDFIWKLYWL